MIAFLNQHDENYQQEIFNNMKIFMDIEDFEDFGEQTEFLLNCKKENDKKIYEFFLGKIKLRLYIMEARMIVVKK